MKALGLDNCKIGLDVPPFIVAEMSGNHNQSLERALAIVDAAAACGVHAVKIQTYTADTMTIRSEKAEFQLGDSFALWQNSSLYDLYDEAHTPWEWHKPIFDRCRQHGIVGFSTPFDETAVDFLEKLGVELYKIASFEMTDVRLIRKVASTGKPLVISTGMATVAEIDETVRAAREEGAQDIVLLKCTSSYPATPDDSNIVTIPHMRQLFNCEIGLSDHTPGTGVAVAAVALGASVIEKHFTLLRSDGGVDSAFSMEPSEMKALVEETERAWRAKGKIHYGSCETEKNSVNFRRSLYFVEDVHKGEPITVRNVRAIRPGYGLPTKYFEKLLNKHVNQDVKAGTAVTWDVLG
ncbi:MAG: pseudaminic acid synthase [Candidatus Melainabacteria bacterium]|nr:pseudaminic acid synthase [Candidatus Melainabacteria bacterium]